jgi:hypothetical protein
MALETGTYISDLVITNPTSTDPKSQGDDHIRLIKSSIKATFPNVTGAVTPTQTELNYVDGVTSSIQSQINLKGAIAGQTWTGTHSFSGATQVTVPTKTAGTNTTDAASCAFVNTVAFSSQLPAQTGNSGKFITTNGTTASWSSTFANLTFSASTFTDYTETLYVPTTAAAYTISLSNGTLQKLSTIQNTTITLPSSVSGKSYALIVAYGGTHTITWAGGTTIKWASQTAPTTTSSGGRFDIFIFTCDGTNTYGRLSGANY